MMILKKTIYAIFCFIVGVSTLSGCIEEYEADISSDDTDLLVVEGSICSAQLNKFILTRTQAVRSDYQLKMVTGAKVSVHGSDGSEYLATPTNGYYTCQIGTLNPNAEYYLHIETDGEVYESDPQKPLPTEMIAEVKGVQYTQKSNIDVLVTPEAPLETDKSHYYLWTYDETWEVHPDYTTLFYYDIDSLNAIYNPNQFPERGWKDATSTTIIVGASQNYEGQHIRSLKMYDIDRSDERMFYRYSGLIHQRAITKAEYEYELARRQASSEMGGLFTPQPSSLPTNIRCLTSRKHVIGYVGCSLNTSDYRFFLDAKDFYIYRPQKEDARKWIINPDEKECCRMVVNGMFLCIWEDERDSGGDLTTGWARRNQLDVRLKGAYIVKPWFWED